MRFVLMGEIGGDGAQASEGFAWAVRSGSVGSARDDPSNVVDQRSPVAKTGPRRLPFRPCSIQDVGQILETLAQRGAPALGDHGEFFIVGFDAGADAEVEPVGRNDRQVERHADGQV